MTWFLMDQTSALSTHPSALSSVAAASYAARTGAILRCYSGQVRWHGYSLVEGDVNSTVLRVIGVLNHELVPDGSNLSTHPSALSSGYPASRQARIPPSIERTLA